MSSGYRYGPLEALLHTSDGSIEAPISGKAAATLLNPNPTVWISFAGRSNESVATFIQSVQRIAFQHSRMKDDEWVAELASTCLTDKALLWYLELEKGTQSSWAKLRTALLQQYLIQLPADELEPVTKKTSLPPPIVNSSGMKDIGRIEVVRPEFGDCLGYLSQDRSGKFVVDTRPERALTLQKVLHTDSDQQQSKIYSLKFVNPVDPQYAFLGLKLIKSQGEDPDVLPPLSPGHVWWNYIQYVPSCRHVAQSWYQKLAQYLGFGAVERATTAYATWDFVQTTESLPGPYYIRKAEGPNQQDRVASAVWNISSPVKDVAGLGLTWPSGDSRNADSISEIRLDAVLHNDGVAGLHVHPYDFVTRASSYLDERHVVLVFKQISSLTLKPSWAGGPTMAQRR